MIKAYYLHQMGIQTWVRREPRLFDPAPNSVLMIVIERCEIDPETQWLQGKQGSLLQKMLYSIGLTKDTVTIFSMEAMPVNQINTQMAQIKPKALLFMGRKTPEFILKNQVGTPVVVTQHPLDLLMDPKQKKNAFNDFGLLSQYI